VIVPNNYDIEVLVVDNNSNDDTPSVVSGCAKASPIPIKYLLEKQQGSNHARNRGIKESTGSYIVFTDDDVIVDPLWVSDYMHAFSELTDAACISGRVTPEFLGGRPEWLSDKLLPYYGEQDLGDGNLVMEYPKFPVEMNIAFPRDIIEQLEGFSTLVFRGNTTLMSNDGAIFFERMKRQRMLVYYISGAKIKHLIPEGRTKKEWILRRVYWQAVSDVVVRQIINPGSRFLCVSHALLCCRRLILAYTGGNISPRKAYWNYESITFEQRVDIEYERGIFRGYLCEAFRF
jgi:glycosyltransferase involved in cell wall biosynthesis